MKSLDNFESKDIYIIVYVLLFIKIFSIKKYY